MRRFDDEQWAAIEDAKACVVELRRSERRVSDRRATGSLFSGMTREQRDRVARAIRVARKVERGETGIRGELRRLIRVLARLV